MSHSENRRRRKRVRPPDFSLESWIDFARKDKTFEGKSDRYLEMLWRMGNAVFKYDAERDPDELSIAVAKAMEQAELEHDSRN